MGSFAQWSKRVSKACASCGKPATHISFDLAGMGLKGDLTGKTLNGQRCKGCGQVYCLACKNPARDLLKCENCGQRQFSFLVDGK